MIFNGTPDISDIQFVLLLFLLTVIPIGILFLWSAFGKKEIEEVAKR